ncbi:MAG: YidC/Oxa1 family membrane protein insertase [Acidimicrobiia bacterium]
MNPFTALVNGLGWILSFFYDIIPTYGIAIILLTLLVSFLLFPLTLKQTRSMKAMQEIQPEVKRIQKEYKDNREEMQKQVMALYQERGVNPAAGCLPLLLQMPIWFALFQVLRVAPEVVDGVATGNLTGTAISETSNLGQALLADNIDFMGMHLLETPGQAFAGSGLPDAVPYIILVLIVIVAGYYQTRQTTKRAAASGQMQTQPAGMQTAMKIMPIMFGVFSWNFPAGLVLYFATSNLFRIGQQAVIFGLDDKHAAAKAATSIASATPATEPPADAPTPPRKPASNTSKKRKQRRRK